VKHSLPLALIMFLCLQLAGCGQQPTVPTVEQPAAPDWPPVIGAVPLVMSGEPLEPLLDVGVVIFTPAVVPGGDEALSAVRDVESKLLATRLRQVLTVSGAWGAVRLLPESSLLTPLEVSATLVYSDGSDLVLRVRAVDATGRIWIDEALHDQTTEADYPIAPGGDPFADLWHDIANRLAAQWALLSREERRAVLTVAELRYAASLAPQQFADYLEERDGRRYAARLPAESDPMLKRIAAIRGSELMFIDAVDEQYVDLQQSMTATYAAWCSATKARADWLESYGERVARRDNDADAGSFASLQSVYSTYRAVKVQEQDLFDYALGFRNEAVPTVMEYEGRAIELKGSLESRYRQWRALLADIFRLEQGF
jgi:hypothetical protein